MKYYNKEMEKMIGGGESIFNKAKRFIGVKPSKIAEVAGIKANITQLNKEEHVLKIYDKSVNEAVKYGEEAIQILPKGKKQEQIAKSTAVLSKIGQIPNKQMAQIEENKQKLIKLLPKNNKRNSPQPPYPSMSYGEHKFPEYDIGQDQYTQQHQQQSSLGYGSRNIGSYGSYGDTSSIYIQPKTGYSNRYNDGEYGQLRDINIHRQYQPRDSMSTSFRQP